MAKAFLLLLLSCSAAAWGRPLLVVSIDGLDHRYLRDRDELGLKIPTIRRLLGEAQWADKGVIGVMPTVTFPSHTSMMTGVAPQVHGIIDNNQANGQRYWFSSFLKVPTLWDAAKKAGKTVGAVHWPVTVGSTIDYDFPEHYKRKQGAGMDWEASVEKSTPGLVDRMVAKYPSLATQWVDDRARSTAAVFIMQTHKPDLMLVHLIDHDAEAHETGPFTQHAKAMLELLDEYLGRIVAAMPKGMALALVSDHGFERIDKVTNPWDLLKHAEVTGQLRSYGTHLTTNDPAVAEVFRKQAGFREIPASEWDRFLPGVAKPAAAFEAPPHTDLARSENAASGPKAKPSGTHGFWPTRANFRSTYLLWGPGVQRAMLGEIDMLSIAGRLARVLDVPFGKD